MVEDAPKHWSRFGSPLRSRPSLVEAEPRLGPLAFLDKADAAKEPVHAAVDGSVRVARERRRHPWPGGRRRRFGIRPASVGYGRPDAFPHGIIGPGATPGRQGRGCENTLGAMPHQALRAGGRSRHDRCRPCGAGRPGGVGARHCRVMAYDAVPVCIGERPKCASPPVSFAHCSAVLSRAPIIGSVLPRGAPSAGRCHGGSDPRPASQRAALSRCLKRESGSPTGPA